MLPLVAHDLTSLSRMTTAEPGSLGREENYSKQRLWSWPAWSREILGISPCFSGDYQTLVIEYCLTYNTRQVVPILYTNTSWNHFQFFARCPLRGKTDFSLTVTKVDVVWSIKRVQSRVMEAFFPGITREHSFGIPPSHPSSVLRDQGL